MKLVVNVGVVLFVGLIGGAFLLGSASDSTFPVPFFSAGYIACTGALVVVGILVVAQSLWTVVVIAVGAALVSGFDVFLADRLPK